MEVLYYFDLLLMDWLDLYNSSQFILGAILLIDVVLLLLIFVMFEKKLTSKLSSIAAFLVIINAPALYDSFGFIGVFVFVAGLIFIMHKLVSYLSFVVVNSNSIPGSENSISKSVFFSLTGKKSNSFKKAPKPVARQYIDEEEDFVNQREQRQLGLDNTTSSRARQTTTRKTQVRNDGELDG